MWTETDKNNAPEHGIASALSAMSRMRKQVLLAIASLVVLGILLFAMTTAWYSNVAETTGLIFETESWGFEGQVSVQGDAPVTLAPGQSGSVNLSIANEGEQINVTSVSVDKSSMSSDMQKRLYFYVPKETQVNGETLDRIYVSPFTSYNYTIMPKSTLLLTEDVCTDTPLCYEWVYDVLGYYVFGTVNLEGRLSEEGADSPVYIRPIVYDYEKATYGADGQLLTVDGTTSVSAFLTALSQTDGYEPAISTVGVCGRYYPVAVDADVGSNTATGLWVYLCTQGEINSATQFDTQLGTYIYQRNHPSGDGETPAVEPDASVQASISSTATICIAGQNLRTAVREVDSPSALSAAVASAPTGECPTIRLMNDILLTSTLELPAQRNVILDLNGKILRCSGTEPVVAAIPGSSVTIMNGTIDGTERSNAVRVVGAQASFSGVTIEGRLDIEDLDGTNTDHLTSVVCLSHSTVKAEGTEQTGVLILGNGTDSSQHTALIVDNSTIESTYVGIMGSHLASYSHTSVQVIHSTVKGAVAGIYQPQSESRLVISDSSTIEGFTGLVAKRGSILIKDSTVAGTAAAGAPGLVTNPTTFDSGSFAYTGAGIYLEASESCGVSLHITGSSRISSLANEAILVLGPYTDKVSRGMTSSVVCAGHGQA